MTRVEGYQQVCITVQGVGISGAHFVEWLNRILSEVRLDWVAARDVDVSGDSRQELLISAVEVRVLAADLLVSLMSQATWVEWATCFFCETEEEARSLTSDLTYKESTLRSALTVRVVDMGFMYVIGREEIVRCVTKSLPKGEVLVGTIDDMEYPE